MPQGKTEAQVFRALKGHNIVAGGNAPGMPGIRSPTLKGSYYPELREATGIRPFQGRTSLGRIFRGRCPRLLY